MIFDDGLFSRILSTAKYPRFIIIFITALVRTLEFEKCKLDHEALCQKPEIILKTRPVRNKATSNPTVTTPWGIENCGKIVRLLLNGCR